MACVGTTTTPARLRMTRTAMIGVGILTVCMLPLVAVSSWLLVLLVLPVLAGVHVWRTGVDIDEAGVTVRATLGTVAVPWLQVSGVQVRGRGELWLVRRDGGSLRLPTLRVRDLGRLHEASGGRLGLDPAGSDHAAR